MKIKLPSWIVRILALTVDAGWCVGLFYLAARILSLSPIPDWKVFLAGALSTLILSWIQIWAFGGTLGSLLWRTDLSTVRRLSTALFASLVALGGVFWVTREALWKHPLALSAQSETWNALTASPEGKWVALPFFYTLGVWPSEFDGTPVFYELPYETAPPSRFVGHIIAHWGIASRNGETWVRFSGPKTPPEALRREVTRETVQTCVLEPRASKRLSWLECLRLREKYVMNSIQEIRKIAPTAWEMKWFRVKNQEFLQTEEPQGIYLRGDNAAYLEEHYILINPKGNAQTIALKRPKNPSGRLASEYLSIAIRSMKLLGTLGAQSAWINQKLSEIRLDHLKQISDPIEFFRETARIQSHLISKISVEPAPLEPYYHLGGTAMMALDQARKLRTSEVTVLPADFLLQLDEWTTIEKPLLQAASRFAEDIAPNHPSTSELKRLWFELSRN